MNPRVLVVSPHFPPINAPDMHRVRLALPEFIRAGWDVTVLTVADPTPLAPVEPELLETVPAEVRVLRAATCSRRWTRWLGVNNVALRSLPFLFLAGCRLLAGRRHDIVYFSTTMFIVMPFGRIWRRLYGVPYVIDLQDPWVSSFYERPGAPRPPGGWKYLVARRLGLLLEGWTMRRAEHLITVSPDYPPELLARHPDLVVLPWTVLPFGSPDSDFDHLRAKGQRSPVLPPGGCRLAFAGALGPGMMPAVDLLFTAVKRLQQEGHRLTLHFYGTSYAAGGRAQAVTTELARRHGIEDSVQEHPDRLPYFQALQVSLEADANLLFGSTDLGFIPSKLLSLVAARRPVLAIVHEAGALARRLDQLGLPYAGFHGDRPAEAAVEEACSRLRELLGSGLRPPPAVPPELHASAVAAAQMAVLTSAIATRT